MKKTLAFFISLLLLSSSTLWGQHATLRFNDAPINLTNQSVLIVPFEKGMYLSDVNPVIARANQMTTDQIISRFSAAIDQSLRYTFEKNCRVSSFEERDSEVVEEELNYIYSKLKLEYELVSETEEKTKLQSLKEKIKKEDNVYQRGQIRNGQVITKRDDRTRYMKAVVKDQQMLDSMHNTFNNKYFLFVNELDVSNDYRDGVSMQQMNYQRLIKLHYTLYHKDGSILSTGISMTNFPATENDIDVICSKYFPILAEQIYADLFPPEEDQEKEENKRILNLKKWK